MGKVNTILQKIGGEKDVPVAFIFRDNKLLIGLRNYTPDKWKDISGAKEGDVVFVFKAETTQEPKLTEPEKFSEWKWCKVSEIPSNFINRESLKLI